MENADTETLLAILSSLLDPPIPEFHVLLDALICANGEVEAAANSLQLNQLSNAPASRTVQKRTTTGVLDEWLASAAESDHRQKRGKVTAASTLPKKGIQTTSRNVKARRSKMPGSSKQPVPLIDVLRPPSPSLSAVPRLAPLVLSNPSMVENHTPCTLHLRILPPELACRLFCRLVDASKEWKPHKWWLFDRLVESPHKTSFYARQVDGVDDNHSWQEESQYWYNGCVTDPPAAFPPEMEEACQLVENVVNEALQARSRYSLEWGGTGTGGQGWKANVAASNCYTGGKEGVGFHSDQLTYLGPFPTIASLSLGTTRVFSLREVIPRDEVKTRHAQTFNIPVVHNSLVIMHASTQERYKHSIPRQRAVDVFRPSFPSRVDPGMVESNCRINITFRFYRPDFRPASIPRCRCNIPCVLRADMKGRSNNDLEGRDMRYFWMCYAGAQNDGKGCSYVRVMDVKAEGRGPFVGDHATSGSSHSTK